MGRGEGSLPPTPPNPAKTVDQATAFPGGQLIPPFPGSRPAASQRAKGLWRSLPHPHPAQSEVPESKEQAVPPRPLPRPGPGFRAPSPGLISPGSHHPHAHHICAWASRPSPRQGAPAAGMR